MSKPLADEIRSMVSAVEVPLAAISDAQADASRGDGAWTRRQILGHMIDSTAANHQRFVRAQYVDELRFPSYDAPGWVLTERYDLAAWRLLVDLWIAYTQLLAHILDVTPGQQLTTPVWVDWYGDPKPISLAEVAQAYVDHMRGHLDQLLAGAAAGRRGESA